jgi:small-conductance mechanosensitive channel
MEEIKEILYSIKSALEFKLFEIQDYSISLYNLFVVVLVLISIRLVVTGLERLLKRQLSDKKNFTEGKLIAITKIGKYIIYVLGFILALKSVNINITPILIGSSALFVGLGFGLQEAFRDFVAGLMLLFEGDVMVGDVVEMENETVGVIKQINLRTSKVRTRDGIMMIVPNSQLTNDRVINWSNSNRLTRFNVEVGVAYGSDTRLVEKLLLDCAAQEETITERIKPFVKFADFGDSSLDFSLYFWSDEVWRIERTKSRLRFAIDQAFRDNNVTIPFPQRDLHFKSKDISLRD